MLEAKKSKWFEKIFTFYNRNLIKRRFHSLQVCGLINFSTKPKDLPLITIANHSSWWDGLILFEIFSRMDFETYVLMEEKQLKDLPLFRKLGAFSIVRESPKEALKSIQYSANILINNHNANLWVFPQGEILPNDIRPIKFFNGISKIISKSNKCCVIPIALRYEFLNEFKPNVFAKIGEIQSFRELPKSESKTLTIQLAKDMTNLLNSLNTDILDGKTASYQKLL